MGDVRRRKDHRSCLDIMAVKLGMVTADATPPNWEYIGLVFIALFSSSITLTFLFPFIPEMILYLGYTETQKGSIGGLIASAVFAGRVVGSFFWGWLADKKGRKLVLVITIFCNGIFALVFGFAQNLAMALLFRFLCGTFNGTVAIAKAVIYDISDNSNQALSMTFMAIAWATGLVIGPLAGGVLASPGKKWPEVIGENNLFSQFPYLLPSLVPFLCCTVITVIVFFKFDETLVGTKNLRKTTELTIEDPKEEQNCPQPTCKTDFVLDPDTQPFGASIHSIDLEPDSLSTHSFLQSHDLRQRLNLNRSSNGKMAKSVPNLFEKELYDNELKSRQFVSIPDFKNLDTSELKEIRVDSGHDKTSTSNGDIVADKDKADGKVKLSNGSGEDLSNVKMNGVSSKAENDLEAKENLLVDAKEEKKVLTVDELCEDRSQQCLCMMWCYRKPVCKGFSKTALGSLMRFIDVWKTVFLYCVMSFSVIAIDDVFPVFASTKPEYGGMDFSTGEIGVALGAMTLPLIILQAVLYPFLTRKLGIRKSFLLCCTICMVTSQLIPMIRLLNHNRVWQWTTLLAIQIPFKIAINCCFSGIAILINNSVPPNLAATVNGLAMTLTALGRTAAPIIGGATFSWTVEYGMEIGPPFDVSFTFFMLGLIFFVAVCQALLLHPRLDQQRK